MKKKRFVLFFCIFSCIIISSVVFSGGVGGYDFSSFLSPEQASTGTGTLSSVTPTMSGAPIGGTSWTSLAGSTGILLHSGRIVGGNIVSATDNNQVVAYNLITGDTVVYKMNAGDTVKVDYTSENDYRAKMDKDVEAETRQIRFIANDDNSILIIRKTPKKIEEVSPESREYGFYNGLIIYENNNIIESINTSKSDSVAVDKEYETGFECYTLDQDSKYNYNDKNDNKKGFSLLNKNKDKYKVCMKKTAYDEYKLENVPNSALLDVMNNNFLLKSNVEFRKDDETIYESFDKNNKATIETRVDGTTLVLKNKIPVKSKLAEIYSGVFKITERKEYGVPIREFGYNDRKNIIITKYSSDIGNNYPYGDVIISYDTLYYYSKDGENVLTMYDPESELNKRCLNLLKEALTYFHSSRIENEYLEMC